MTAIIIIAKVLGVILLCFGLLYAFILRHLCWQIQRGSLMYVTVFQWCVLPLIIGIGLIISGKLLILLMFPVIWILSRSFQAFFTYIFPIGAGLAYGGIIFSDLFPGSRWLYYGGSCIGAICMFVVCTILFAIVFTPPKIRY